MRIIRKIKEYLVREEWNIAIRPIGEKRLYRDGGTKEPFDVIPNNFRYWCADPFIVSVENKDYLFFEMFDRFKGKGVIGYRVIDSNGKIGKMQKAYESAHHLSFPFVFEHDGEYYMMPESSYDRNLTLLRAKHFPDQWEVVKTWFSGEKVCDSVMFEKNGNVFLLTQPIEYPYTHAKLDLYKLQNGEWHSCCINPVVNDSSCARMAGAVINEFGKLIRPGQDCKTYGDAVCFSEMGEVCERQYCEKELKRISVDMIHICNPNDQVKGIHTYNSSNRYEVIDLKRKEKIALGYIFSAIRK